MNHTSKSPSATKFGASFPLNKLLPQHTNERVFQLSCYIKSEFKPFFFNKGFPFRINFLIIFIIWIKQQYILTFTSGEWVFPTSWKQLFLGATAISFF